MAKKKKPLPKKRPIPAGEAMQDMPFPVQGVDVSSEFSLQPEETCPTGLNVRAWEPLTMRRRGGSRPGISKYVAQQVPAGAHLIQHLNYVVDPTEAALLTGFDPLDGGGLGGIDDPSTNNLSLRNPGPRRVRRGGSGIALNRHRFTRPKPLSGIAFRQANPTQVLSFDAAQSQAPTVSVSSFGQPVLAGTLLVVVHAGTISGTITVSDSFGNLYQQAGSYVSLTQFGIPVVLSVWYATSNAPGNPQVSIRRTPGAFFSLMLMEYIGVKSGTLALDNVVTSLNAGSTTNLSTNTIGNNLGNEMLMGFFASGLSYGGGYSGPNVVTLTAGSPFTARDGRSKFVGSFPGTQLWVEDVVSTNSTIPASATVDNAAAYVSIGASFIPA